MIRSYMGKPMLSVLFAKHVIRVICSEAHRIARASSRPKMLIVESDMWDIPLSVPDVSEQSM